jgi:hypothetical protein
VVQPTPPDPDNRASAGRERVSDPSAHPRVDGLSANGPDFKAVESILPDLAKAYRGKVLVVTPPFRISHEMGAERCERMVFPFIGLVAKTGVAPQLTIGVALGEAGQHLEYPCHDSQDLIGALRATSLLRLLPVLDRTHVGLVVESASMSLARNMRQQSRAALADVIAKGCGIELSRAQEQIHHQLSQGYGDIDPLVMSLAAERFPFKGNIFYLALQQGLIEKSQLTQRIAHSTIDMLAGVRAPEPAYQPLWERASEGFLARTLGATRRLLRAESDPVRVEQIQEIALALSTMHSEELRQIATKLLLLGYEVRGEEALLREFDRILGAGAASRILNQTRGVAGGILELAVGAQRPPKHQKVYQGIRALEAIQRGFERLDEQFGLAAQSALGDPDSQIGPELASLQGSFKRLLAGFNRNIRESFPGFVTAYPARLSEHFSAEDL